MLIFFGLYGFYRIPQDYKITKIPSNKTILEKTAIIKKYLQDMKILEETLEVNYFQIRYTNKFFNLIDMFVFFDNNNFFINVRQKANNGYLDFGTGKRATRRIIKYINTTSQ